jgi:gliding motility-associated-like protein
MKIAFINPIPTMKKISLLGFSLFVCQFAFSAIWYVDTAGDNTYDGKSPVFVSGNNGPLKTLSAAYDSAAAGDTIYMGDGFFAEHFTLTTKDISIHVGNTALKAFTLNGSGIVANIIGTTGKSLTVTDTFDMSAGYLKTDINGAAFKLAPGAVQLGGSSNSFVDGPYLIGSAIAGTADVSYHLGEYASYDYRKIRLTFTKSASDTTYVRSQMLYGAAPVSGALPAGIRNISTVRYFQLFADSFTTISDFYLEPGYDYQNIDDEVKDSARLRLVMHKGSGDWISLGGNGSSNNSGTLYNTTAADTLAYFTYANDSLGHNVLGSDEVFAVLPETYSNCLGTSTNYNEASLSLRFPITSYFWDFGDMLITTDTSSQQYPSFTYADTGLYTVKLKVMNSAGYEDSAYTTVRILGTPAVNFGFTEVCESLLTDFEDSSVIAAPASIAARTWLFGDGASGSGATANHLYTASGSYNVRLIVSSNDGCTDSADKTVRVFAKPYVDFPTPSGCVNDTAVFLRFRNTNPPDNQVSYSWFIDGVFQNTDTLVKYKFTTPGSHNANMVAVTINGCADSTLKTFTIQSIPVPNFTAPALCISDSAYFLRVRNTIPPDAQISWRWNVDGVLVSSDTAFKYKFNTDGPHTVQLKGTSLQGCKDSISKTVTVYPLPIPDFTVKDICISDTAIFNRIANTNPPENQITWSWKSDGNNIFGDTMAKAIYITTGSHTASLYGVTVNGCRDSITKTFTVYGLPLVGFVLDPSIAGNTQTQCLKDNQFTLSPTLSTTQSQVIVSAFWKWDDGNTGLLADSAHSYAAEGNYNATLVAITDKGCADSASQVYSVKGTLNVNFSKIGNCVPDSIIFSDSALTASSAIASRMWKVNGANASAVSPAKLLLNSAGPYAVTYIITTAEGCSDSITKNYTFTTYPNLTFNLTGTSPFCAGDSLTVRANGGTNVVWLNDNDTNRTKVFYNATRYRVRAFNGPLCFVEDDDTVVVYPNALVTAFSDTTINRGGTATLYATGGTTYSWSPAAGLNATTGATVKSTTAQTRNYIVSGTDANGCSDDDTVTVTVIDPPFTRIPNIITPNADGDNDVWNISDLNELDQYDLTIVDYSGKVVLESSNYLNDWNAVDKNNKELPDGVYYYLLRHRGNNSELKGIIHVIR